MVLEVRHREGLELLAVLVDLADTPLCRRLWTLVRVAQLVQVVLQHLEVLEVQGVQECEALQQLHRRQCPIVHPLVDQVDLEIQGFRASPEAPSNQAVQERLEFRLHLVLHVLQSDPNVPECLAILEVLEVPFDLETQVSQGVQGVPENASLRHRIPHSTFQHLVSLVNQEDLMDLDVLLALELQCFHEILETQVVLFGR